MRQIKENQAAEFLLHFETSTFVFCCFFFAPGKFKFSPFRSAAQSKKQDREIEEIVQDICSLIFRYLTESRPLDCRGKIVLANYLFTCFLFYPVSLSLS
jgi:hypothetical protein